MYINFSILDHNKLEIEDFLLLQMAKQNKNENLGKRISSYPKTRISFLTKAGYLHKIQGNNTQSDESKIRLTKKGSKALEELETPVITPEDIVLFNWMSDIYTQEEKLIGNKRKTRMYIAQFRVHSGVEKNELAHLLEVFLRDGDNMAYNNKLEFVFFKPSNLFQSRFELDQSRLWQYYQKNKEQIDTAYQKRIK